MPLRQTLLHFTSALVGGKSSNTKTTSQKPGLQRTVSSVSSASSDHASDTITVEVTNKHVCMQLPTPSESVTDMSSQTSETLRVEKSRSNRTKANRNLDSSVHDEPPTRNVSGETLVEEQESAKDKSVGDESENLKVVWDEHESLASEDDDVIVAEVDPNPVPVGHSEQEEEDEDQEAIMQRRVVLKAKIEENARIRAEKYKEADAKATRRSSRANLLNKAEAIVSEIAASVLGKRKTRVDEDTSTPGVTEPDSKKSRLTEAEDQSGSAPIPQKSLLRKDKRWLASGLYAGQVRTFDGRLTESKNKKKATQDATPQKDNTTMPLPMFAGERLLKIGRDFKLPFDVFAPLPPGQPKPDEWKKVNKNVFVGAAACEWRTTKFSEQSVCMCRPETGCDHDCVNRIMYYECDELNCLLTGDQCGNRSFEGLKQRVKKGGKYNVGVEVIKTVDRGYGVRSNRTFEPNQIIVEYTGEIITQAECEGRMRKIYKDNACYYLMLFDQNMIIDATRGSIARFVNHSCEPNCRMEKWTVGGNPRMALFAGDRGVMTGEELTYDYNFDPYSQKNVQACRCGAKNCRGVLGPRPKTEKQKSPEEKDESQKAQSKPNSTKKKVAEVSQGPKITKAVAKGKSSSPVRKSSHASPMRVQKRTKLVKKSVLKTLGSTTPASLVGSGLSRHPSKLRRILDQVKDKTSSSQRVVSSSSASDGLIQDTKKKSQNIVKTNSIIRHTANIQEKTASVRRNVVRTVRGGRSGKERSIRAIDDVAEVDVDMATDGEDETEDQVEVHAA